MNVEPVTRSSWEIATGNNEGANLMSEQQYPDHVDLIDMELADPNLRPVDGRGGPVPPGTYEFEIEKALVDQSQAGNAILKVSAKIVTPGDAVGRTMTRSYVLKKSDFHRGRLLALIAATGAATDENGAFSREGLIGLHFTADVISRPYEALDARGQKVVREGSEWVSERHMDAPKAPAKAAASAPAQAAPGGKRPTAPPNGGARR